MSDPDLTLTVTGEPLVAELEAINQGLTAFNEADALPVLHGRILDVLDALRGDGIDGSVLYVDDGSRDRTWPVLQELAAADTRVALVRLSRNFGKEAALTAGLDLV